MAIINFVRDYERVAKFQLGRYVGLKGPGVVFIVPIIQSMMKVDMREIFFDVPPQTNITKDNANVDVDFVVYMRVVDPEKTVLEVVNFVGAARQLAMTTLRAVIGDMNLDDVLSRREEINQGMQTKLDEVTNRWGVKVTAVEIREIQPPPAIQEAMTRQMSAERTRRAQITESEGQRDAEINVAEGNKRAAILRAEGEKQAAILEAEGHRQAQILEAEGFANALQQIYETARGVDANTMGLQYLDMMRELATKENSTWIVPLDFTRIAASVQEQLGAASSDGGGDRN
ncbi:MAG: SPFH domain-containing protein [Chloroflexi bacterium]|nr:SPFH domain-containing protein [Chloroflexota bacterium]